MTAQNTKAAPSDIRPHRGTRRADYARPAPALRLQDRHDREAVNAALDALEAGELETSSADAVKARLGLSR